LVQFYAINLAHVFDIDFRIRVIAVASMIDHLSVVIDRKQLAAVYLYVPASRPAFHHRAAKSVHCCLPCTWSVGEVRFGLSQKAMTKGLAKLDLTHCPSLQSATSSRHMQQLMM